MSVTAMLTWPRAWKRCPRVFLRIGGAADESGRGRPVPSRHRGRWVRDTQVFDCGDRAVIVDRSPGRRLPGPRQGSEPTRLPSRLGGTSQPSADRRRLCLRRFTSQPSEPVHNRLMAIGAAMGGAAPKPLRPMAITAVMTFRRRRLAYPTPSFAGGDVLARQGGRHPIGRAVTPPLPVQVPASGLHIAGAADRPPGAALEFLAAIRRPSKGETPEFGGFPSSGGRI